jgi:mono/diheme cytochrome c family protein
LHRVKIVLFTLLGLGAAALVAQQPSVSAPVQQPGANQTTPSVPAQTPGAPPVRVPPPAAYPHRAPADPAVVQRGRQIFSANCSFCHGSDARGGEGGPNLIRSELVMNDNNGELITTVVQNLISRRKRSPASPPLFTARRLVAAPQPPARLIRWWATRRPAKPTSTELENAPPAIPCRETSPESAPSTLT